MIRKRKLPPNPYVIVGLENKPMIKATPMILYHNGILKELGNLYSMGMFEEVKKKRSRDRTYVRFLFFFFMKETFQHDVSLVWLGNIFDQDHTTVINGIKTFKDLWELNAELPDKLIIQHDDRTTKSDYSFTKNQLILWMEEKALTL